MIICQCAAVSDGDVVRAVEAGAHNLSYVCQTTGAGQDCGSCVFSVRRVICQHEGAQRDTFLEVEGAAS
ncbi:(2Fe-2S)-binding protein [Terrabacter sp. 2RAF25]|uniref:(2Fe-2S)-binding protein n=1 Tax=Terrabacter sp. 2RAF25 TaxID=3232998 RepID=UPI003F9C18C5